MNEVRWGIIGCGNVCEVKSGPAFSKVDGSILHAVMRRDALKAEDYAKRHRVLHWYSDAESILQNPEINAVYIATPPSTHKEYAIRALEAHKAVYVEKPMSTSYQDCLEMIEASKRFQQPIFVAHYRRALPYFLKVKELVEKGTIGKVLGVNIRYFRAASANDTSADKQPWRVDPAIAGGGYLFDLAPHTIDIVEYIVGEIEDACGNGANLGGFYPAEDTVAAQFKFKNGALGTALWCFVTIPEYKTDNIEIIGSQGTINFSTFDFTPIVVKRSNDLEEYSFRCPEHIQQPLIQTIVDELLGYGKCPSNGETGARANWFMDKILGRI